MRDGPRRHDLFQQAERFAQPWPVRRLGPPVRVLGATKQAGSRDGRLPRRLPATRGSDDTGSSFAVSADCPLDIRRQSVRGMGLRR
mmetsp:Transcript_17735/g.30186  ORF Transcript_17735/g.30186 Transcript_17735/m.30186 type:complete len:86 (+) Transcript_17735:715-972(+)